jgi:hypothetical protein
MNFKKDNTKYFDISKELFSEGKLDHKDGHKYDTGPRFGWAVHRACEAGKAYQTVEKAWYKALKSGKDFDAENVEPKLGFPGSWRVVRSKKIEVVKEWSL